MLHFETATIFRNENDHSALKRQLKSIIKNFKIVIDEIAFLLNNKLHNYFIVFDEAKSCYFMKFCKKNISSNFFTSLFMRSRIF